MKFSHETFPFACHLTGRCCVQNVIALSPFDIFRLAVHLNKSASQLFQEKILTYTINKADYWMEPIINTGLEMTCPFLLPKSMEEHVCEIYESRPLVCRLYPLKYNPEEDYYFRRLDAENRCSECFSLENENYSLKEFVEKSGLPELTEEYKLYREFLFDLVRSGFNIIDIKHKKPKQKLFFAIQAQLYETFPKEKNELTEYPWQKNKKHIESMIEEFQNSN